MKVHVEINSMELKELVINHIREKLGSIPFDPEKVLIQVQSRQNYRVHEWEKGDFRAIYEVG